MLINKGSKDGELDDVETRRWVDEVLDALRDRGPLRRVLLIPPDFTRVHSGAGSITCFLYEALRDEAEVVILPAIGTHFPMDEAEIAEMFPGIPLDRFRDHDWRGGVVTVGEITPEVMSNISEKCLDLPALVQVDRLLVEEPWDAILSIGQLVPHEVIGIANHVKNILVGVGGPDLIHKSHWLGAVYGMEKIMGRADTPVRTLLQWAADRFLAGLPIVYLLTVRGTTKDGRLVTRTLHAGDDKNLFHLGAMSCQFANVKRLGRSPRKVVVWLDPGEYKSTWLGNKAIYRTRMAIADGGELIILAPGVRQFGEDAAIDALIRQFGYRGTQATRFAVEMHPELLENLSAAAHLIHGSSEGRFKITYCPGSMTKDEIEGVGYEYGDLSAMIERYGPDRLSSGWNVVDGEEVYFVPNPALGLWGTADRLRKDRWGSMLGRPTS